MLMLLQFHPAHQRLRYAPLRAIKVEALKQYSDDAVHYSQVFGSPGIISVPPSTLELGANDYNVSTTGGNYGTLIFYHCSNGGYAKNNDELGIILSFLPPFCTIESGASLYNQGQKSPSPFSMDAWKSHYSNATTYADTMN